ncbi:unnamed protein product [Sphagnum balticum]
MISLKEEPVEGDHYSSNPKVMPTFHDYAPFGNVSAEVVDANYGRVEDFQKLAELGINVKDAIVGSMEWVEQNIDLLGVNVVAYLNLDSMGLDSLLELHHNLMAFCRRLPSKSALPILLVMYYCSLFLSDPRFWDCFLLHSSTQMVATITLGQCISSDHILQVNMVSHILREV